MAHGVETDGSHAQGTFDGACYFCSAKVPSTRSTWTYSRLAQQLRRALSRKTSQREKLVRRSASR